MSGTNRFISLLEYILFMGKVIKHYRYKGKLQEKEVNDSDCLTKDDVIIIIGKEHWKDFEKWIYGQTGPVLADRSCGYYSWDVQKYRRHHIDKDEPATPEDLMEIFQEMEGRKIEFTGSLGKLNTQEWDSNRKEVEVKKDKRGKKKKPGFRSRPKRKRPKRASRGRTRWSG